MLGPYTVTYLSDDDQWAVLFRCAAKGPDGSCSKSQVDVVAKEPHAPEVFSDAILAVLSNLCVEPQNMHKFPLNSKIILI